ETTRLEGEIEIMSYTYQVQGKTVELVIDPSVIAVRFHDEGPLSARARAAKAWSTVEPNSGVEIPDEGFLLVPAELLHESAGVTSKEATEATIGQLRNKPDIADALPVFRIGKYRVLAVRRVVIGLVDAKRSSQIADDYGLTIRETRSDKMVCDVPRAVDMFELIADLDSDDEVRFAEPDLVTLGHRPKVDEVAPATDRVDGQAGTEPNLDMAARQLDDHRLDLAELTQKIATGRRRVKEQAAGCEQMAVRIVPTSLPGGRWKTTNTTIARSIDWSHRAGADILTNSWVSALPSNDIIEELERARTLGRGGLGCVIVVSVERGCALSEFPASLPNVLTMDAGEEYEQAKLASRITGQRGSAAGLGTNGLSNGTSLATRPNLSGACALVLAANPDLTEEQVRDLIGQAAGTAAIQTGRARPSLISAVQSALVATQ
ncbi:MAG: S8 family serine peptidase, partial [Pseudomonadota bacterium]